MKEFAPPPAPGAQSPPLWGSEEYLGALFGGRVTFHRLERAILEITAFERARDYGEHFKAYYGPTIAARASAVRNEREMEFDAALDCFCVKWNRGGDDAARFEKEYIVAVGRMIDTGQWEAARATYEETLARADDPEAHDGLGSHCSSVRSRKASPPASTHSRATCATGAATKPRAWPRGSRTNG